MCVCVCYYFGQEMYVMYVYVCACVYFFKFDLWRKKKWYNVKCICKYFMCDCEYYDFINFKLIGVHFEHLRRYLSLSLHKSIHSIKLLFIIFLLVFVFFVLLIFFFALYAKGKNKKKLKHYECTILIDESYHIVYMN